MAGIPNMPEIKLSNKHKQLIEAQFKTTGQNVRNALKYINNSSLAVKIRKKAHELLLAEVAEIESREPDLINQ